MIVASLFGVPAGLEVHRIAIGEESQIKFEDSWVDISLNEVMLTGGADIFRVFRLNVSGKILTWIGLYRPATEIGPNRGGGFYGAGLWLIDAKVSSKVVHEVIVNLADQIRDLAMQHGKFLKKIADIRSLIVPPPQVALLVSGREKLTGGVKLKDREGELAFIADPKNIIEIIEWAQNSFAAGFYSQVIAAPANQFVAQQSQFLKGFVLFGSVSAAIDTAYQSNVQTIKTTKEQLKSKQEELAGKISELKLKNVELNSIETQLLNAEEGLKSKSQALHTVSVEANRFKESDKQLRNQINTLKLEINQLRLQMQSLAADKPAGFGYSPGSSHNASSGASGLAKMQEPDKPRGVFHFNFFQVAVWLLCIGLIVFAGFKVHRSYGIESALRNKIAHLEKKPTEDMHKKREDEVVSLKKQIEELNKKKTEASAKLESTTPNSEDQDQILYVNFQKNGELKKFTYTIKNLQNGKPNPITPEIRKDFFELIWEACKLDNSQQNENSKIYKIILSEFTKSPAQIKGEILLPKDCSFSNQIFIKYPKKDKASFEISLKSQKEPSKN
jgi:hypothetical protein